MLYAVCCMLYAVCCMCMLCKTNYHKQNNQLYKENYGSKFCFTNSTKWFHHPDNYRGGGTILVNLNKSREPK